MTFLTQSLKNEFLAVETRNRKTTNLALCLLFLFKAQEKTKNFLAIMKINSKQAKQ